MESIEIIKKTSFERWHYLFSFKGYEAPIHNRSKINRHVPRRKYFFDLVVDLLNGTLAGKRILDLRCNAGF